MEFGEILKSLREENELSRDMLAKKLKISYSAISKYETNVRFPDKDTLRKIADFFSVSTDYLLGRINNKATQGTKIEAETCLIIDISGLPSEAVKQIEEYADLVKFKYTAGKKIKKK